MTDLVSILAIAIIIVDEISASSTLVACSIQSSAIFVKGTGAVHNVCALLSELALPEGAGPMCDLIATVALAYIVNEMRSKWPRKIFTVSIVSA